MDDRIAHLAVRNLDSIPYDGVADGATGDFAVVADRHVGTNLATVNLRVLAYIARRHNLGALHIPRWSDGFDDCPS